MTLTEFLLARISEDEADVEGAGLLGWALCYDERRVLAECAAKRQILSWYVNQREYVTDKYDEGYHEALSDCVKRLAAVDADHPDYNPEWRP